MAITTAGHTKCVFITSPSVKLVKLKIAGYMKTSEEKALCNESLYYSIIYKLGLDKRKINLPGWILRKLQKR